MRTKKVNRYYCDFCKKSGCASGHMKAHEKHCTANPNRECRLCKTPHRDFVELRKYIVGFRESEDENYRYLPKELRDAVGNCPACILATLRQEQGRHVYSFDFKKELEQWWANENQELWEAEEQATLHAGG